MQKKWLIIIGIIIVIIIILLISLLNKNEKKEDVSTTQIKLDEGIIQYDEDTELYYIMDNETKEIIAADKQKEALDFYLEHPDYKQDPSVPRSTNLQDFLPDELTEEEREEIFKNF